jgi:hypothetical protein
VNFGTEARLATVTVTVTVMPVEVGLRSGARRRLSPPARATGVTGSLAAWSRSVPRPGRGRRVKNLKNSKSGTW